nr:high mobility group B protein 6-like isoform X2 [Ipomoea batatas]
MDNVNIPQGNEDRDLGLIDFMDEENLEQFIDLIRGENEEPMGAMFCQQSYGGCENISGYLADDNLFDYDNVGSYMLSSANVSGDVGNILPRGENDAGEVSSETTPEKKGTKADRSKTLVCERKRRGRMKEMLYSLRSLVPNITKFLQVAKIIGQEWKNMTDDQKAPYEAIAAKNKEQYVQEMEVYRKMEEEEAASHKKEEEEMIKLKKQEAMQLLKKIEKT